MSRAMLSPALRKVLTSPSKIASALDWKRHSGAAVLSVCVRPKGQGLDVALVDKNNETTEVHHVPSFSGLRSILDHNRRPVCGMVVEWPLTSTGRMGGACGAVLRALDEVRGDASVPVCLWDPHHFDGPFDQVDSFGRCAKYGTPLTHAHEEVLNSASSQSKTNVLDLWRDFRRVHWPEEMKAAAAAAAAEPSSISRETRKESGIDNKKKTKRSLILAKA